MPTVLYAQQHTEKKFSIIFGDLQTKLLPKIFLTNDIQIVNSNRITQCRFWFQWKCRSPSLRKGRPIP